MGRLVSWEDKRHEIHAEYLRQNRNLRATSRAFKIDTNTVKKWIEVVEAENAKALLDNPAECPQETEIGAALRELNELEARVLAIKSQAGALSVATPQTNDTVEEAGQDDPPPFVKKKADTLARLKTQALTVEELAASLGVSVTEAETICEEWRDTGVNIHRLGDRYSVEKTIRAGHSLDDPLFEYESDENGEYVFAIVGDTHLGSKYCRLDVLADLYENFAREGITRVYHCGNWIEGEARFNKFDLVPEAYGMTNQVEYFLKHYPQHPGIETHYIDGDDHEGWYSQREGVEVGRYAEMKARQAGRTDLRYLSYMEAYITMRHKRTGESCRMLVAHPGGGSSYAESYVIQKLIESYEGGEKPAIATYGHYHKMTYNYVRNVHAVQPGCTKDQDVFGRKKRLHYVIGGLKVYVKLDERGAVKRFRPEFLTYFNRDYYQGQWSLTGAVNQTPLRESKR